MTARWDFGKSIASLAFHPGSDALCVAAGHKLYAWKYKKYRLRSDPSGVEVDVRDAVNILLKTPRSLRAVHFHPTGAPLLLTAEVRDMDVDALARTKQRLDAANAACPRARRWHQRVQVVRNEATIQDDAEEHKTRERGHGSL